METVLVVTILSVLVLSQQVNCASLSQPKLSAKHENLISKLTNYRMIRPYRSTPDGAFLTYDLSLSGEESRSRRSADDPSYNFVVESVDGDDMLLSLDRVTDLFSSNFVIEKLTDDDDVIVETPRTDCFFQGHVGRMKNTTVAINTCHGLSGVISVGEDEYIIEPVDSNQPSSLTEAIDNHGTHIIYRTTDHEGHEEAIDLLRPIDLTNDEEVPETAGDAPGSLKKRAKRRFAMDQTHYVKTMLVADSSMQDFHGDATTLYLATVMNIVNKVYAHHTLGLNMKFVILKVVLLNQRKSSNIISEGVSPLTSLRNANKWAEAQNTEDDEDPDHFDMTLYYTKLNFGASGYANVGDVCHSSVSAALVLDREGLRSAFVAAHEAAHLFGVDHDDDQSDKTCRRDGGSSAIMASFVTSNFHNYYWSVCSRNQLSRKLRNGDLDCFSDPPVLDDEDTTYPGLQSTLDEQCRFNFGPQAITCPEERVRDPDSYDPCAIMFCLADPDNTRCRAPSRSARPMEGTPCGDNRWCIQGSCQPRDNLAVSEGVFEWHTEEWGPCSITCGGEGVKSRAVTCREVTYDKTGRLQGVGEPVRNSFCHPDLKPEKRTQCPTRACAADWTTGPWSECDVTCGTGRRTRDVTCDIPTDSDLDWRCFTSKPDKTQTCELDACPETGECVPHPGSVCKTKNYKKFCVIPGYVEQCCYTCEEQKARMDSWRGKRNRN